MDGQVSFECGNHQDSVTCAQFSYDGTYLATADMAGFIQVWKVSTKAVVWSFEMGDVNVSRAILANMIKQANLFAFMHTLMPSG